MAGGEGEDDGILETDLCSIVPLSEYTPRMKALGGKTLESERGAPEPMWVTDDVKGEPLIPEGRVAQPLDAHLREPKVQETGDGESKKR